MDQMSDLMMWNLTIGFLSATFVLPVIQQPKWSPATRSVVTLVYSIIAGLGTAFFSGAFDHVADVPAAITSVLTTLVAAIATYKGFAKPTGLAGWVEASTSPTPRGK